MFMTSFNQYSINIDCSPRPKSTGLLHVCQYAVNVIHVRNGVPIEKEVRNYAIAAFLYDSRRPSRFDAKRLRVG